MNLSENERDKERGNDRGKRSKPFSHRDFTKV